MKKALWSTFVVLCSALMFSSNALAAANLYKVQGDSMKPFLNDGDVVELKPGEYEDGDMVLGKTKTRGTIVKTLKNGQLVGENKDNSLNYNAEDVEILGSVSKVDNYDSKNITRQAHALGVESPIKSVYAGREFVLMLHESTAVTGFGSNLNDVLGIRGGLAQSTGELVKVSDLSGFERIVTGQDYAFGLRPDDTNNNLFHLTQLNSNIGTNPTVFDSNLVKDFGLGGIHYRFINWPDASAMYIDKDGYVLAKGSDAHNDLGIGNYLPYGTVADSRYIISNDLNNWYRILEPNGEDIIYPTDTTVNEYFLSNNDNTSIRTSMISEPFTISNEAFTVEIKLRDFPTHPDYERLVNRDDTSLINFKMEVYDGTLTDTEINSGNFAPIFTDTNTHAGRFFNNITNRAIAFDLGGATSKDFKVKISSSYVGWDMRIRERKYLKNAEKLLYRSNRGRFSIIDDNKNVYVYSQYGDGLVRPVTFTNMEAGVEILPETAEGQGSNTHYGIIDTNGRMWLWQSTSASIVSFPDIEGSPFYSNYEIVDMSIGENFFLAKTKHRITGETNAWAWGENDFGTLGIGSESTNISTPTLVLHPDGSPLSNIQDIAAGEEMSVIVQNTENGQLVWTAGRNNRGQLGGGVRLIFDEPQLVPGLSNIDRVTGRDSFGYALSDTDQSIHRFGGGVSYAAPYSFHTSVGYPKKLIVESGFHSYDMGFINQSNQFIKTGDPGGGGDWDIPKVFSGTLWDSTPGTYYTEDNRTIYNNGNERLGPIKDFTTGERMVSTIDENGRWWTGLTSWSGGGRYGFGPYYEETGEQAVWHYPHLGVRSGGWKELRPVKTAWQTDAPAIFEKTAAPISDIYAERVYAVTETEELWEIKSMYASKMATPLNDIGVKEIFSGKETVHVIDNNGDVWALGHGVGQGGPGRLGDGTTTSKVTPSLIDRTAFENKDIVYISSGEFVTFFVSEDGDVYASGKNDYSLIPNKNIVRGEVVTTPVKVNLSNITYIFSGDDFALALNKEGKVLSWGFAANGSLGNGFTTKRNVFGTAFGNSTPELNITTPLKPYYLSRNGNSTFTLEGTITEHDQEETSITTTVLGSEKEAIFDSTSWYQDNYNQVVPQDWQMSWDVSDFGELDFQSLTKISALDGRGGIKEQFFSAEIIVDNEIPAVPTWGDNCLLDTSTGAEVSCQSTPMFQTGGTNGVNQPVRLYINVPQKVGENKAPVYPQISYRVKTKGGFYINDWSEWETVKTQNGNGFLFDVFAGFKGEAQFKVRATDLAENKSEEHANSMYTILTDAGAEIDKLEISSSLVDNQVNNTLEFNGVSHSGTTITSYGVKRKDLISGEWINITEPRGTWEGAATDINSYTDTSPELLGNTKYEYTVNAENRIGEGIDKKDSVITNPYLPENFMRKVDDNDHLIVDITQDKRNRGEILYRLVIKEVSSGQEKAFDYTSSSVMENVLFDIDNTQVPFNITNNKLELTLLMLGANGNFLTLPLDDDFVVNKRVIDDSEMPFVEILINNKFTQLTNNGVNEIDFSLFATDNVTKFEKLEFQVSHNGNDWYGQTEQGSWVLNHWTNGRKAFTGFQMGSETGRRALYVRARDEASNLGFTIQKITIADLANRGTNAETDSSAPTVYDARELTNSLKASNEDGTLHVNSPRFDVKIPIPTDGNLEEVQFSFDGVTWSPWERMSDDGTGYHTKSVILPYGDGRKAMMTRYRNKDGATTTVQDRDVVKYTLDTAPPNLVTKTKNGPLITNQTSISLYIFAKDNFSQSMDVSLDLLDPSLNYVSLQTAADGTYYFNEGLNIISIEGLVDGRNEITLRIYDEAGNYVDESINIIKKAP